MRVNRCGLAHKTTVLERSYCANRVANAPGPRLVQTY